MIADILKFTEIPIIYESIEEYEYHEYDPITITNLNSGGDMRKAKKVLNFTDDLAEKLYKPVTRKLQRRRVNVNSIDEIWAADLIDMQAFSKDNNGIKYLLTVIDVCSKFVWIVPLKRKTEDKVANEFSRILKERRPSKTWVDKGREFHNKDVQN